MSQLAICVSPLLALFAAVVLELSFTEQADRSLPPRGVSPNRPVFADAAAGR